MTMPSDSIVFSMPMFFLEDGGVDWKTFERYVEVCCASAGVEVVYAMAYNTRYAQLSEEEISQVNRLTCEEAKRQGKFAVVGHPLASTTSGLVSFSERMAPFEPWAISVLFPERYFGEPGPVLDFLSAPGTAGQKVLIHEMKLVSGFDGELINWPLELLREAMGLPEVVAIKEDSKDDAISEAMIRDFVDSHLVVVAGGGKRRAQTLLPKGLRSWLCGSLMLYPQIAAEIYRAFMENDEAVVRRYIAEVEKPYFDQVVSRYGWHVSHKAALQVAGYGHRYERGPMTTMTDDAFKKVEPLLREIVEAMKSFAVAG